MIKVYKITNLLNEKIYVGITSKSLEERWKNHVKKINSKNPTRLALAIKKYGIENFQIELIEYTLFPNLREIYWINFYKSFGLRGYNATPGGEFRTHPSNQSREEKDKITRSRIKYDLDITKYRRNGDYVNKGGVMGTILDKNPIGTINQITNPLMNLEFPTHPKNKDKFCWIRGWVIRLINEKKLAPSAGIEPTTRP